VKKVDKAQGKLTLQHGPLENLDMPAMTMVFRVKDAAWLGRLKAGDNIRFMAEKLNGAYTVTRIEAAD
jgi:Cu/Ag efflux protein CusF